MTPFSFITDEDFRSSLEADLKELESCHSAQAWKAVHVLSGSIVEAVLVDHILSESLSKRAEALKLDLNAAITICKENKVISEKTSDLLSVIRGYRNLIHPGRMIRLKETVDKSSAEVAKALIDIVLKEVENLRRNKHGYTAEQISEKIKRDASVDLILMDLIKETRSTEIERLLFRVLPDTYISFLSEQEEYSHIPESMELCFRTALEQSSDDIKKRIAEKFVKIIKEESYGTIQAYGTAFFRGTDLKYLKDEDKELVKKYILGQLENNLMNWLNSIEGIGRHIRSEEVLLFTDPFVKNLKGKDIATKKRIKSRIIKEWLIMPRDVDQLLMNRLRDWKNFFKEKGAEERAIEIENLIQEIEEEIPF